MTKTRLIWFAQNVTMAQTTLQVYCGRFVAPPFGEQYYLKTLFLMYNSHIAVRQIGNSQRQNCVIEALRKHWRITYGNGILAKHTFNGYSKWGTQFKGSDITSNLKIGQSAHFSCVDQGVEQHAYSTTYLYVDGVRYFEVFQWLVLHLFLMPMLSDSLANISELYVIWHSVLVFVSTHWINR